MTRRVRKDYEPTVSYEKDFLSVGEYGGNGGEAMLSCNVRCRMNRPERMRGNTTTCIFAVRPSLRPCLALEKFVCGAPVVCTPVQRPLHLRSAVQTTPTASSHFLYASRNITLDEVNYPGYPAFYDPGEPQRIVRAMHNNGPIFTS